MLWNDQVLRPNDVGEIEHLSGGFERVLITGSVERFRIPSKSWS